MRTPSRLAPRDVEQARRRQVTAAVIAVCVCLALVVGIRSFRGGQEEATPSPSTTTRTEPTTTAPPSSTTTTSSSSTSTRPTTATTTHTYRSTGRFAHAGTDSPVRGRSGQLMTYRIEVERGSGVAVGDFATAVDATLRDRRGWTRGGQWRFKRLGAGSTDLVIRLATPDTVDEQCGAAGAQTHGYSSCRFGPHILLNLDRWLDGVPHIDDLALYRRYLVNHEVGHGLGKGHLACPGRGELAPVMLQQTLGLHGCRANAWPLTADSR